MSEQADKERMMRLVEENTKLGRAIHADAAMVAALAGRVEDVAGKIRAAVAAADIPEEAAQTIRSLCDELGGGSAGHLPAAPAPQEQDDLALALQAIWIRAGYIATHTNENASLNAATIITHIVEALQGDEGAAASLIVLGVEWPIRRS